MSLIRLIITDKNTVLTGEIHGSLADPIVASLTAEPETFEELESAAKRFRDPTEDWPMARWFRRDDLEDPVSFTNFLELEPHDAGIVAIDLAGRTLLCESTYSFFSKEGTIHVEDRLSDDPSVLGFPLQYRLPDDWLIVSSIPEFEGEAQRRRNMRLAKAPFDPRPILYGEALLRFLAEEILSAEDSTSEKIVTPIHAAWMMLARDDLNGMTPREVLHEKRDFIDFDLHSRSLQYSFTKDRPPDLSSDSVAYTYAGFGTHEIVVYYDLVRFLMENYQSWIKEDGEGTVDQEVARLTKLRDQWLRDPNPDYTGRAPNAILESERKRRNLTMTAAESIIDDDCPICVEMSQIFDTPMFWHLDGCNMDDLFAFSFHDTVEAWEQERNDWEEFRKDEMRRAIISDEKKELISDDPEKFLAIMRGEIPW